MGFVLAMMGGEGRGVAVEGGKCLWRVGFGVGKKMLGET